MFYPYSLSTIRYSFFLFLFVCCFSSMALAGGGWPQPKGKGYFKLSEWWIVANQHFTDQGLIDPNVTTGVFNTSLYAEYGFTNRLTGVLYFPIFSRTYMNNLVSATTGETIVPGEAINTIGDMDISIKYGLSPANAKVAVSASLLFGIPLGEDEGGSQKNLQTGDGEFNQMLQVDAGTSFAYGANATGYANVYAGFNNRTKGFSDEFRFGIETGVGLFDSRVWLIARLAGVESLYNGKTAEEITSTSIFANNTEYTSASIEAAYYITPKIGVSASYATAFQGKIIFARPSYSVGVFFDMK